MEDKYRILTTLLLIMLIVIVGSQVFTRAAIYFYSYSSSVLHMGVTMVSPEFELLYILAGVLVLTGVLLLLIRYRLLKVLSVLNVVFVFFLSYAAISIAVLDTAIVDGLNLLSNSPGVEAVTILVYLLPVLFTVYYIKFAGRTARNVMNVALFAAVAGFISVYLNVATVLILIAAIALYDYISVFVTKHMITLAKGTADTILFSSISLMARKRQEKRRMMLGGGDLVFPAIMVSRVSLAYPLPAAFIVAAAAMAGLSLILIFGRKGKAYPAMAVIGPLQLGAFALYILATLL